ncbi:MAG: electron transport complex subunit RsxC [Christensenellales bacterium]
MPAKYSFSGGVHPLARIHNGKTLTEQRAFEPCGAPEEIILPLSQHIGAPSSPIVSAGDKVDMGQMIAQSGGYVSVPCFSSVSGTVKAIEPRPHILGCLQPSIVITNDFEDRLCPNIKSPGDLETLSPKRIIEIIKNAGIVGMGGAAFPTHVKLSPPPEKPIDTVIINGAECEPYLTADHRLMLERPEEILYGLKAVIKALGAKSAFVGIEDNKADAIKAVSGSIKDNSVNVAVLKVKYPQGAEKQLIYAITKRKVPSGGLPMDVGVIVINAATAYQICLAIRRGLPLYERVVTVSGSVKRPSNLLVRLGTPIRHIISHVGGFSGNIAKVIAGGPMMGVSQANLDACVIKGTSGLLALDENMARPADESACIRCGKCVFVCPIGLMPYLLSDYSERERIDDAEKHNAADCIECGCCSYICPANRHLVQRIRLAKSTILSRHRK